MSDEKLKGGTTGSEPKSGEWVAPKGNAHTFESAPLTNPYYHKPIASPIQENMKQYFSQFKFIYLATPYTKYHLGIHNAANDAAKIVAKLLLNGVTVYSPIVHTHQVGIYGNIDPLDHSIWLPFDQPFLDVSDCLLVCKMKGWDTSYGVKFEIEDFTSKGKKILYLNPDTLEVVE